MAEAIYNVFSRKENCVHYISDMALLEKEENAPLLLELRKDKYKKDDFSKIS